MATNDLEFVRIATLYIIYIIDAGTKVKTADTRLCFQHPCALIFSGDVYVTMQITLLTSKYPAVRFALYYKAKPIRLGSGNLRLELISS